MRIRFGVGITFTNADYEEGGWVVFVTDNRGYPVFDTAIGVLDNTVLGGHTFQDFALPSNCETLAVEIAQAIGMEFEHAIASGNQAGIHQVLYHDLVFKNHPTILQWSPDFIRNILHGKEFRFDTGEEVGEIVLRGPRPLYEAPLRARVKLK
ncbi:MAG: hypothetical protein OXG67_09560 [bacterium]|nr:hypothetical protein [bacterium]MCY3889403.1 hypothetical protein [bacterium]